MASGRATSIRIAQRLRAALESGLPLTYEELSKKGGCTVRSVRNFLRDAPETLGVRVEVVRGPGHAMRVTLADDGGGTIDEIARITARATLRPLFPLAGTSLDRPPRSARVQTAVVVRGAYEYGEGHLRALRAWIVAASARPRRPVEITYGAIEDAGLRLVWPLGVVIRDGASVYLAGVPAEAKTGRSVHTYALHRVHQQTPIRVLRDDAGTPPRGIELASIEDGMDAPFSVFSTSKKDGVFLHARFTAAQAPYIEGRRWHAKQRVTRRKDGTLEIRFGPADLGETLAWVRQWGESITVLGDTRLRSAIQGGEPDGRA
jgi:hypothetical protein